MPPLPIRLFVGSDVVQRIVKRAGGRITTDGEARLLHVEVTKNMYPVNYLRRLLEASRVISRDTVERFHATPAGQRAIAAAKQELYERLHRYGPHHDAAQPNLFTARALANTFYTDTSTVNDWCEKGLLPHVVIEGKYYFDPTALHEHLEWSL